MGLVEGAWERRRLYALRVRTGAFRKLGIRPGYLLVVEPGARERPGQVVLWRSRRAMGLRRITENAPVDDGSGILPLPFPSSANGTSQATAEPADAKTVGTVVALLRATVSGGLRASNLHRAAPARRQPARRSPRIEGLSPAEIEARRQSAAASLEIWRDWGTAMEGRPRTAFKVTRRWRELETNLSTLIDCVGVSRDCRLAAALVAEAERVAARLMREIERAGRLERANSFGDGQHDESDTSMAEATLMPAVS